MAQSAEPTFVHHHEEGGDENRPYHKGVKENSERQSEAKLVHSDKRSGQQRGKRAGHNDAATGNDAASFLQRDRDALNSSMLHLFFADPRHEKNVVVLSDRDQDREEKCRDLPVEPGKAGGIHQPEHGESHTKRHQIAEKHTDDEVHADDQLPQQKQQDQKHSDQYVTVNHDLITIGRCFEVNNAGSRPQSVNDR